MKIKTSGMLVAGLMIPALVSLNAQQADTLANLPNLLLPKFTAGIVKLKNGGMNKAVLNYDLVTQQMVFLQRNLTLLVEEPERIDTIFMANRTFVPFRKGFYEVLLNEGNVTLFKQHKAYVETPGVPGGYGTRSQTATPNYVHQVYGPTGAIDLKIPDEFKVVNDSQYWIREGDKMTTFETRRQFLRAFPGKQKELEQFISQNRTDFKSTDDVRNLMKFNLSLK